ncbi:MAG: carbonic anhydrase [Pyrinomonadaceae bacterium]
MLGHKFATALNCIDGRVQTPVFNWMDLHCRVQFVDMITEPGADKILVFGDRKKIVSVMEKISFSVQRHNSEAISVVGHFDCMGNPVSFEEHLEQIKKSAEVIQSWDFNVRVIGLYVNEWNSIDVICDTEADLEQQTMRSFL